MQRLAMARSIFAEDRRRLEDCGALQTPKDDAFCAPIRKNGTGRTSYEKWGE
jgi:hypothetical protein